MKDHLQEAKWFIKSLHSRNDTLLRVARSIVEKQTEFLEHGSIAMKPMVLRDIARNWNYTNRQYPELQHKNSCIRQMAFLNSSFSFPVMFQQKKAGMFIHSYQSIY